VGYGEITEFNTFFILVVLPNNAIVKDALSGAEVTKRNLP
jgi:hypothetical protein